MIKWVNKNTGCGYHGRKGNSDVYINVTSKAANIILYDSTKFRSNRLIFGFDGNRLYFREAEKGWSIVKAPVRYTSKLRITDKSLRDAFKQFDGSYKFKYDKDNGLYYIEKISA